MSAGLELHGLVVRRGRFTLGPVDLALRPGRVTALTGANGAGKTTLIRSLVGQAPLAGGRLTFDGVPQDPAGPSWRARVGLVPDDPEELLEELSAYELWDVLVAVRLARLPRADRARARRAMEGRCLALRERLGFAPPFDMPCAEYSHGMRKKTQLVAALLDAPDVVVLDEPRNGLDPVGIDAVERLVRELAAGGAVVLVATHDLAWAAREASDLVALRAGSVVAELPAATTTPGELLEVLR